MTKQEAIDELNNIKKYNYTLMPTEALDMAIEALSNNKNQTDSEVKTKADSVSEADVIYRADAIDALMEWEEDSFWDDECLKHRGEPYWVAPSDVIERLPSAQADISGFCDRLWKSAYDRGYERCKQDAIDAAIKADMENHNGILSEKRARVFEDHIAILPSAQRTGEWLRYGEDGNPNEEDTVFWQCDQCLETYTGRTTRIPNYCPNCGAKMLEDVGNM